MQDLDGEPRRLPVALLAALLVAAGASVAAAAVPSPLLEGPVTGGHGVPFVATTSFDLAEVGYLQEEYFISGTATAYTSATPLASDGAWSVAPGDDTAAYRTRILVYRPINPKKFNGTLVVEWLNVSGGLDAGPEWTAAHTELVRSGYAWMGVSAQAVGVEGGGGILAFTLPLKTVDPVRYGSLVHPGDSFSYDIFSQAGQAIRQPAGASPLGDLQVQSVIAVGESQSAFRLVTYINAVHPLVRLYDGYLVHSRGVGGAPLSQLPQPDVPAPSPALIRTDVGVPVLTFETETDLVLLGYFADRQPDSEHFRLWEVAGTAHADTYTVLTGATDLGNSPAAAEMVVTASPIAGIVCSAPINSGPQHFVLKAALAALNRWVRRGVAPSPAPRLELAPGTPPTILRDAHGNALGGIRTPHVDAPIAALSGLGQSGSIFCRLFGTTAPFDAEQLAALYPDHRAYVRAFRRATGRAVRSRHVLRPDARLMKQAAASDGG